MLFLHTHVPSPILIDLGFISIHWYGLLLTLAVVAGFFVTKHLFKKYQVDLDHLYNLSFYLIIFGLLGARIYHVLNEPTYYLQNSGQILAVWNGGLAIHGALLAGVLVVYFYIKRNFAKICLQRNNNQETITKQTSISNNQKNKKSFIIQNSKLKIQNSSFVSCILFLADVLAPALALGQAIGRWGNYFNQELYGLPTNLPWGIPIALANRVAGFEQFDFFHPTFLYESLANLLVFILLMWLHKKRHENIKTLKHKNNHIEQPTSSYQLLSSSGFIFSIYLISYGLIRILTELIRIDRTPVILGVRLPILFSGLLIVVGFYILWYVFYVWKKKI